MRFALVNDEAPVYLDFGEEFVWRLILLKADSKVASVGPVLKSAFLDDCLAGHPVRLLAKKSAAEASER